MLETRSDIVIRFLQVVSTIPHTVEGCIAYPLDYSLLRVDTQTQHELLLNKVMRYFLEQLGDIEAARPAAEVVRFAPHGVLTSLYGCNAKRFCRA